MDITKINKYSVHLCKTMYCDISCKFYPEDEMIQCRKCWFYNHHSTIEQHKIYSCRGAWNHDIIDNNGVLRCKK